MDHDVFTCNTVQGHTKVRPQFNCMHLSKYMTNIIVFGIIECWR
jgi:hypothetical protein